MDTVYFEDIDWDIVELPPVVHIDINDDEEHEVLPKQA